MKIDKREKLDNEAEYVVTEPDPSLSSMSSSDTED